MKTITRTGARAAARQAAVAPRLTQRRRCAALALVALGRLTCRLPMILVCIHESAVQAHAQR